MCAAPTPFDLADREPLLLPRPVRVELDLAARHTPGGRPMVTHDHSQPPGSYVIHIDPVRVMVRAADDAGERAAQATMRQLERQYGTALPVGRIEDQPALHNRGVMLDVSRTRVPTMAEFGRLVEGFAELKLNHLQTYTEHTFAYTFAEPIWRGCSPLTCEDVGHIQTLCQQAGLEYAANQNCFGHLKRWLELPDFAQLAETQGDWDFLNMPRSGPFSLCPTDPAAVAFVQQMLDELLPNFASALVNIGCDETHDVGQGRSADAVVKLGRGEVYRQYVSRICEHVLAAGKQPMIWGDIANVHPEVVARLPEGTIGLAWGYEPTADFAAMSEAWREAGYAWWACPGTSAWRSFTGRSAERHANVRRAGREAVQHGASGLLITDWGDLGHHQVWPIAQLAIAEAADAGWTGRERHATFLEAASLHVFDDETLQLAAWLEALGDADESIRAIAGVRAELDKPCRLLNAGALFTELHPPPARFHLPENLVPWLAVQSRLEALADSLPAGLDELIFVECQHAVSQALFAASVALSRRGRPPASETLLQSERDALIAEHRRLWPKRCQSGGLEESCAFWAEVDL